MWLLGAIVMGMVPLVVSIWVHSLVADYFPMLKQATAVAAAGSTVVVAVSFSLVLLLELYCYWKLGTSAGGADGAPITGRLQFLIAYVLVPLVPGLAVGYLTLSPATRLSKAIDWIRQPSAVQVESHVGQAIQGAAASETRVAGVRALAQFGSPDALNELARLGTGNPHLLNDPSTFDALATALESFGRQAEPVLLSLRGSTYRSVRLPSSLAAALVGEMRVLAHALLGTFAFCLEPGVVIGEKPIVLFFGKNLR